MSRRFFYAAMLAVNLITYFAPSVYPRLFYYPPFFWVAFFLFPTIISSILYEWLDKQAPKKIKRPPETTLPIYYEWAQEEDYLYPESLRGSDKNGE